MSLILDALKRAERDRRADPMPGLDVPGLAPPRRRRTWLRILGGGLLALALLIVLAVVVRVVRNKRAAAPPPPAVVQQPQANVQPRPNMQPQHGPPQIASPQTGNLAARAAPAPAAIPGTESVSSLDELSEPGPGIPAVTSATPPPPRTATPAPATTPPSQDAAEAAPGPAVQTEAPPASEVPPALTSPAPLRKFREMPPEFRADFPPLNLQVHVYEKESAQRFVIVNDHRYREGENLAEGPHILEIAPGGLVLEFRGEKLLYPIGR